MGFALRLLRRAPARRALLLAALGLALAPASAPATLGPLQPPNPHTAPTGAATMHGDSTASDTTPVRGPGPAPAGGLPVRTIGLASACPAVLLGRAPQPLALCTRQRDRAPVVHLLDADGRGSLAELALPTGNLFGGVYTYLDEQDRMVLVTGTGRLLRIAPARTPTGGWTLRIAADVDLGPGLRGACDGGLCGGVVGITPDWAGRVWIATANGTAGVADPASGALRTVRLGSGESVANSIASSPHGTAVATTHALYELDVDAAGAPRILWRAPYARGPGRKPGQLSWGTGSTPTYFGPRYGTEYLAIVDNAQPRSRLLVFDALASRRARAPRPVCEIPVLPVSASGSENSPIGSGRSVVVASTYGYPYPAYPDDAGPLAPGAREDVFPGGMTRVDLDADGSGCHEAWTSHVRSAAVPKLSLPDGLLYTVVRTGATPLAGAATSPLDGYAFVALDAGTGRQRGAGSYLGQTLLSDALQLAGNAAPTGGVWWQGSISGLWRIGDGRRPAAPPPAVGPLEPDVLAAATCPAERAPRRGVRLASVRRDGGRVVVRGRVGRRTGTRVRLQRATTCGWRTIGRARTTEGGRFVVRGRLARGARARVVAGSGARASRSGSLSGR
jgi:hypothetical protein